MAISTSTDRIVPDDSAAASEALARATSLLKDGASAAALEMLHAAYMRHPMHAGLAGRLADALQLSGRGREAERAYRVALGLNPALAEAWYGLGCLLLKREAFGAAAFALRRAKTLAPAPGPLDHHLAEALFALGHIDEAIAAFHCAAAAGDPGLAESALRSTATIIPGSPAADHAAVLNARSQCAGCLEHHARRPPSQAHPNGKLRIGYISAFFAARNWMKPVWGLINHHDRQRFEIHLFADRGLPTAESGYKDHPDDVIHTIDGIDNAHLAGIIARTGIDVLVDLNGYSHPDRLALFPHHPAPVVAAWFNTFATTGIAAFDWLVGDASVIRPEEEAHYIERIHRLPGSYLAFDVLYPVPPIVPPPAIANGHITFGCLGSHYKLTRNVLAAWGGILGAAPTSRLFLKNATLEDRSTRQELLLRLADVGIDPARVTLDGRAEHFDFLRAYGRVDIALDTFPYNGGTTTSEALWQGVPVLTFDGDRWASRTSRSLLLAAGLADWVMPDETAYVDRAIALARDPAAPGHLAALRTGMRDMLRASPACDTRALCRAMEAFFEIAVARDPAHRSPAG